MGIHVKNNTSNKIEVAINQWGNDGQTGYFPIAVDQSDTWSRTDSRGFVLSLRKGGTEKPYYVQSDSSIVVGISDVKDNGRVISPLSN
ncbi:hypothetical protein KTQ74_21215 [Pseudomonas chlororaphis]|uniref:hypothetical protein n=1 Tax=Pseudomonas chlororaphis TaxID=587753 RepID=UPI001E3DD1D7|nr:hypothetical protein [Pseudomonas chlororaphis]MCB2254439.1 hypothetical protein [Pseudomonas chlororaphis]